MDFLKLSHTEVYRAICTNSIGTIIISALKAEIHVQRDSDELLGNNNYSSLVIGDAASFYLKSWGRYMYLFSTNNPLYFCSLSFSAIAQTTCHRLLPGF